MTVLWLYVALAAIPISILLAALILDHRIKISSDTLEHMFSFYIDNVVNEGDCCDGEDGEEVEICKDCGGIIRPEEKQELKPMGEVN